MDRDRPAQELSVLVKPPGGVVKRHRFEVSDETVTIGAAPQCRLQIDHFGVQDIHLQVVRDADTLWLIYRSDGKTTLILTDSSPLQIRPGLWKLALSQATTSVMLEPACVRVDLAFRDVSTLRREEGGGPWDGDEGPHVSHRAASRRPSAIDESVPTTPGPGAVRMDITLITRGHREEFTFPSGKAVTLGRTRTCEVQVPDDGVSGTHARLHWSNGWLVVDDLGSTNGTWINNQRVRRMILSASVAQIELGHAGASVSVRVVRDSKASAAAAPREAPRVLSTKSSERDAPDVGFAVSSEFRRLQERVAQQEQKLLEKQRALEELETKHREQELRRGEHDRLVRELEERRADAENRLEKERRRIEDEREAHQRAREALDLQARQDFRDTPATDPTMPVFALDKSVGHESFEVTASTVDRVDGRAPVAMNAAVIDGIETNELKWLEAIPSPDRSVFRHLALHGSINEEEAVRLLGSPRHFRSFSGRFEALQIHCPFRVRIETSGGLKCYVRDERGSE